MTVVTIREARARLSRLLRRAVAGEEIVIARGGLPVAVLVPLALKEPRQPGLAQGRLTEAFFEPLPADELAAWQQ
jgi:prevent-host-death family protein